MKTDKELVQQYRRQLGGANAALNRARQREKELTKLIKRWRALYDNPDDAEHARLVSDTESARLR